MKSTFYLQIQAVNSNLVGYLVLTLCINQISLRNQFAGGPLLGQAGRFAKASLLEPSYQAKVQTILFPSIRQAYNQAIRQGRIAHVRDGMWVKLSHCRISLFIIIKRTLLVIEFGRDLCLYDRLRNAISSYDCMILRRKEIRRSQLQAYRLGYRLGFSLSGGNLL